MLTNEPNKRILIYYPVIHTQAEMGTLRPIAEKLIEKQVGEIAIANRYEKIEQIWAAIKNSIAELPLSDHITRIYQDGLPVCGKESEIVSDLAKMGSVNHQIVAELQANGAILMGTECPALLMEEYQLLKNICTLTLGQGLVTKDVKTFSDSILHRRDCYIADRINRTLKMGEVGILFLGIFHSLTNLLADDIKILYPIEFILEKNTGH